MAEIYCRLCMCSECNRLTYQPMRQGPNRNAHIYQPPRFFGGGAFFESYFDAHLNRYLHLANACNECAGNLRKFSPLHQCELCGKTGVSRRIHYRSDVCNWNLNMEEDWFFGTPLNVLCCGCWNKAKAVCNKQDRYRETKKLISKLNGEIKKWQKSQRLATSASS